MFLLMLNRTYALESSDGHSIKLIYTSRTTQQSDCFWGFILAIWISWMWIEKKTLKLPHDLLDSDLLWYLTDQIEFPIFYFISTWLLFVFRCKLILDKIPFYFFINVFWVTFLKYLPTYSEQNWTDDLDFSAGHVHVNIFLNRL